MAQLPSSAVVSAKDGGEGDSSSGGGGQESVEEALATNQANLMAVTQNVFDAIISSGDQFPSQLRSMCHCLYQVLCKRFPASQQNNIGAVGTVMFLRYTNIFSHFWEFSVEPS